MANKALWRCIKQQGKTQNKKEHTLYIPKGNIKKANKIKKRC